MAYRCTDGALPIAQALIDCLTQVLAQCGDPTCRASLVPGAAAAWDKCDCAKTGCGGQSWVLINSITPLNLLDGANAGTVSCAWEYEMQMTMGVLRCSKAMENDGSPPSAQQLEDEATRMLKDAARMREAAMCCWPLAVNPPLEKGMWQLGAWSSLGPDGSCAGGQMIVIARFNECRCL